MDYVDHVASEMTCIVSSGALNSTHSLPFIATSSNNTNECSRDSHYTASTKTT